MGLIYDSGDSSALMSGLSANLTAATSALESTDSACVQLEGAVGSGELTGQGYSAVNALFAEIIRPCLTDAKSEIEAIQEDLDAYTQADGLVSQYGSLNEDQLTLQLECVRAQRDATEQLIETNRQTAAASTALPALGASLEAANAQLEVVLTQLENDIQDIEDKLRALREFAAQTTELFVEGLTNFAAVTGDTVSLLYQLDNPGDFNVSGAIGTVLGTTVTRKAILDYLAGHKIKMDAKGRLKYGARYLYNSKTGHLYSRGAQFNDATGTRIDHYRKPIKAGLHGLAAPADDFRGWKDASNLGKTSKLFGAAGTVLTVGSNANAYFGDGVQGNDVRDFAVDTAVDVGSAAAAAGIGAAAGSFVVPPIGTVIGAGVGLLVNFTMNVKFPGLGNRSLVKVAKDSIKGAWDWVASKFW